MRKRYEYRLVQTGDSHHTYRLHFVFTSIKALRHRINYVRGTDGRVKIKPIVQRREIGHWTNWKNIEDI